MTQAALTGLQLALTPVLPWSTADTWILSLSQTLSAVAGTVALLGGLAGKPRPSGGFAAAAWCAAVLLRLAA
jgi:hypothetical protein